ncbi:hypothetical protein RA280_25095 [Cupriavidus sp. CV2]|uniref:hypothetical protein n=1 Tax=Cupriavidus ulmosensis TaxID=3065913 RepID=UPI00296B077C|nr:hypothetical protein [Cupriavidus sp. CV2]MDW3684970.1 hypothetical protein [Cupriavidus sp. CV2]
MSLSLSCTFSLPRSAARALAPVLLSLLAAMQPAHAQETAQGLQEKAMKGDFLSQRNLSYCLQSGCLGLERDRVKACMWRKVIVLSGERHVTDLDTANLEYVCGKLGTAERDAAMRQADALARQIYGPRR